MMERMVERMIVVVHHMHSILLPLIHLRIVELLVIHDQPSLRVEVVTVLHGMRIIVTLICLPMVFRNGRCRELEPILYKQYEQSDEYEFHIYEGNELQ